MIRYTIFVLFTIIFSFNGFSNDKNNELDEIIQKVNKQDSVITTIQLKQRSTIHSGNNTLTSNLTFFKKGTKFRLEAEVPHQTNGIEKKIIINNGQEMWQVSKGIKRKLSKEEQSYICAMYKKGLWDFFPGKKSVRQVDSLTIIESNIEEKSSNLLTSS